jgi:AcrR family transcriptional regulator
MATIDATSASGYVQMNVEDIVRGAGVSRRTFYELFTNKHDAFLAAFDAAADALLAAVRSATQRETTFEGKVIAGVRAFLEALAATPGPARVCIVEALAAGPDAVARRTEVMGTFARLIEDQAPQRDLPAITAEVLVGGIYEAIFRRIADGRVADLPALVPDLIELTLLPYVGAEDARRLRAAA